VDGRDKPGHDEVTAAIVARLRRESKMIPYRPHILTEVPRSLEKRLKMIEAIARHTAQENRARPINNVPPHAPHECFGPTIRETYPELAALWQWLILKYSPDQPRVPAGSREGGQWAKGEGSEAASDSASSATSAIATDTPVIPVANHPVQLASLETGTMTDASQESESGKQRIHEASTVGIFQPGAVTQNEQVNRTSHLLLGIATEVVDAFGPIGNLSPSQYGTKIHTLFAAAVRAADIPGVEVEQTFPAGPYGSTDSIRTDVILRDETGRIIAIYDLKTGGASLEPRRVRELRAKTGTTSQTYVFQIRVPAGLTLKYRNIARDVLTLDLGH
jgi:hypothetical protein